MKVRRELDLQETRFAIYSLFNIFETVEEIVLHDDNV